MDNNTDKLLERIAHLEFVNDQLTAELEYVDKLLRSVGFQDGLNSVKSAAQELSEYNQSPDRIFDEGLPDAPPGLDD